MKKSMSLRLAVLCLVMCPLSLQASYIYDVSIDPSHPTSADFITANINGWFAATNYDFSSDPIALSRSNNTIIIDYFTETTAENGLTIVVDYTLPAPIGELEVGDYVLITRAYIDNSISDFKSTRFSVTPIPLPPALGMLLSGILGLLVVLQRKRG